MHQKYLFIVQQQNVHYPDYFNTISLRVACIYTKFYVKGKIIPFHFVFFFFCFHQQPYFIECNQMIIVHRTDDGKRKTDLKVKFYGYSTY